MKNWSSVGWKTSASIFLIMYLKTSERKLDVSSSIVVCVYESISILHSCCCENHRFHIFHSSCRVVSSIWIHFCDDCVGHDKIVLPWCFSRLQPSCNIWLFYLISFLLGPLWLVISLFWLDLHWIYWEKLIQMWT